MTKFSHEIRLAVVRAIADGMPIKAAARRYGVSAKNAKHWYRLYQAGGFEAVLVTRQTYTGEFKWQAIQYRQAHGLSYGQAAAHLGIPSPTQILVWERRFEQQGFAGLPTTRKGRIPSMAKAKQPKKPDPPLTPEEKLELENKQLRMEVDYLKKLNALIAKREKSEKKTK